MPQDTPTTPEVPNPTENKAPRVSPKSGLPPNPLPPVELPQDDPLPGATNKGD